ncbi:MAG: hypothetical protein IJI37_07475, partial [Opitutales bacterium]|nr:hypothetical protein [Opitutales bacterium]
MEEENIDTPVPEQTPKKRGRKPKAEESGAEVAAPKKRGRPRKTADAAEAPESAVEDAAKSLDEVLDTAVRQRKAGGRKAGSAAPRHDGPAWRDAPAPSQETPESSESGENEIFIHSQGDDFEFTKA